MPLIRPTARHRYAVGAHVWLVPRLHHWLDDNFVVLQQLQHNGWPHYELLAPDGTVWQASQLELASKPLPLRK